MVPMTRRKKDKANEQTHGEQTSGDNPQSPAPPPDSGAEADTQRKPLPVRKPHKPLPRWRIVLHNDEVNYIEDVVEAIVTLTPLKTTEAQLKTQRAHKNGAAALLTTHRERAELYVQQFASHRLTVTAEPER